MTWVYLRSEPNLYTVGFYDPDGNWHADTDHNSPDEAARRVHWLNGGHFVDDIILQRLISIDEHVAKLEAIQVEWWEQVRS